MGLAIPSGWFAVTHISARECDAAEVGELVEGLGGSHG